MQKLLTLASVETFGNNQSAQRFLASIQENLCDIELYLNENEALLPQRSEVSVAELFTLLESVIHDAECIEQALTTNHQWLAAMAEAQ